jgi:hypothetical protein
MQLESAVMRLWLLVTAVIASTVMMGCTMDDRQVAELVSQLQNVREWRYDVDSARGHAAWLRANVAWDIVGAHTTMSADAGDLLSDVDEVLKSGLAELAAGPAPRDMIAQLDGWRVELGTGACAVTSPANDDAAWLKLQLTLAPPKAAAPATRAALEGYAKRATAVRSPARITCGGTAALIVGKLDDKLVPLLRK